MEATEVFVVTGAAGFIGSYLTGYLNHLGFERLILVDDFSREDKLANLEGKEYLQKVDRNEFWDWARENAGTIKYFFHLGARTDTTEMNYEVHKELNLEYSKKVWALCTEHRIPLVYASSAATYGNGELGYSDSHDLALRLQPMNPYGRSKHEFDLWALEQANTPPYWHGMKFFNVYGPNEYHKGRMASVVYHAYKQIQQNKEVKLFRSHNPQYRDGEQLRDFIYVKDIVRMCVWLMHYHPESGIYNAGSGEARTFKDLVRAIFITLQLPVRIQYIDTPEDIRDKYQYHTEADMSKMKKAGYTTPFFSIEDGVFEYVNSFLKKERYY